ncbi:DUF1433 domain-containing protein [Terrilactibacillus sp. S3-3]|nr:DUF1433 domain-containing protein [Terrilactibacillus sp. S3-3]
MQHEKKNEERAYTEKQEKRITEFYKYNLPSFKTITFTNYNKLPTESVIIHGYINGNKRLTFSSTISLARGETNFEAQGGYTDELYKLLRKDVKSVSEIEKLKNEQKENESESK